MNKQVKIQEGIDKALIDLAIEVYQIPAGKFWAGHRNLCRRARTKLISRLRSRGVVLRVDRELPEVEEDNPFARLDEQAKMLEAGCGFFEPLVEE